MTRDLTPGQGDLFAPEPDLPPEPAHKKRVELDPPFAVTLDLTSEWLDCLAGPLPPLDHHHNTRARATDPISSDDTVLGLNRAIVEREEVLIASVELCVPPEYRFSGDEFLSHMNWTTDDAITEYLDMNFPGAHPRNIVAKVRGMIEGWAKGGVIKDVPHFIARHPDGGLMPAPSGRNVTAHRPTALGVRYYREMLVVGPFGSASSAD